MAGEPNELPEGGEGGGGWGGLGGWRGEFPQELPVGPDYRLGAVLKEILTVRARLQQLENVQIAAAVMGGGARLSTEALRINRPDELPEGGEGGGGWGGWPGGWPGERPEPELPPFPWLQRITELETQLTTMSAALQRIETQINKLGGQVEG